MENNNQSSTVRDMIVPVVLPFVGTTTIMTATALAYAGFSTRPLGPEVRDERNQTTGIVDVLEGAHGGFSKLSSDRDFDHEGINDIYVTALDGSVYALHSTERPFHQNMDWHYEGNPKTVGNPE